MGLPSWEEGRADPWWDACRPTGQSCPQLSSHRLLGPESTLRPHPLDQRTWPRLPTLQESHPEAPSLPLWEVRATGDTAVPTTWAAGSQLQASTSSRYRWDSQG